MAGLSLRARNSQCKVMRTRAKKCGEKRYIFIRHALILGRNPAGQGRMKPLVSLGSARALSVVARPVATRPCSALHGHCLRLLPRRSWPERLAAAAPPELTEDQTAQIGRASCRERA